jgi:PilZ domain
VARNLRLWPLTARSGRSGRSKGEWKSRLPIALIVQLTQAQSRPSPRRQELTFTDNISAHGACVVSSRRWQRRELMDVTSVKDQVTLRGKVMHCQKRTDNRYGIGLRFAEHAFTWLTDRDLRRQLVSPLIATGSRIRSRKLRQCEAVN